MLIFFFFLKAVKGLVPSNILKPMNEYHDVNSSSNDSSNNKSSLSDDEFDSQSSSSKLDTVLTHSYVNEASNAIASKNDDQVIYIFY